jgi:hypothetical protein
MSRIESFVSAFAARTGEDDVIRRIEIPLIQRDYAQGRKSDKTDEIRQTFLDVLYDALVTPDEPVSLDFIYGEIANGVLSPLDGQQRLTTLFLLHWYFASRSGEDTLNAPWAQFTYATRQSAKRFCERIVSAVPPNDVEQLSAWIVDQHWYQFVWRHDPTIQAMLVMLDAIHEKFRGTDAAFVWRRLTDAEAPAISFHLLPLPDMGSAEDLYIKMNSRGKPLTEFENFKAHLEATIEYSRRAKDFAKRIDVEWSDLLWQFRGNDDLVDDEFLRYLEFVTEICEWSDRALRSSPQLPLRKRTERVFGEKNPLSDEHLKFLFSAFDVWVGRDVASVFDEVFHLGDDPRPGRVRLFLRSTNLLESCCRLYGQRRLFSLGQTLLLYAMILHLTHDSAEFPVRIRMLRNLIEGSTAEVRAERMPRLIADTRELILDGAVPKPGNGFNIAQIDDEAEKQAFRAAHPDAIEATHELEDHALLRGSLGAIALDARVMGARADAFTRVMASDDLWGDALAALLTFGDYQRARGRDIQNPRFFQFGTPYGQNRDVWRALLTGATRADLQPTADVLSRFLDTISGSGSSLRSTYAQLRQDWLTARERAHEYDWRYYMVRYTGMRSGGSGIYATEQGEMGYSLCNLRGGMSQMNSLYRDPYLYSIWLELGRPEGIEDPWFIGYEWHPRRLRLTMSGVGVRCTPDGFTLTDPTEAGFQDKFDRYLVEQPSISDRTLRVDQAPANGRRVDRENRIQIGASVVRELLNRGL